MRHAGLDDLQTGIKKGRRNINNFRYADDTTLMAESKEELKSFLMKVKAGLKLNIRKTKIMPFSPIMRNTGLDELQTEIKIARRNSSNLRYADDTTQ